jgi:molybdenum-dependent DNA-binding transcriptional regulator ModE
VRHDGWTPERQRLFLVALAAMGTVDSAAQAVGMSRISAYNLKKRVGAG